MPDITHVAEQRAKRARFEEFTARAQLDRFRRIQSDRPLAGDEMQKVERLLVQQAAHRARLAATASDRPAHRRVAA